jgi:hypothetical protein
MNAKYIAANITNHYYRGVIVRFKFEENIMASTRFANISDLMMFSLCFFDHLAKSLVHISSMVGDLCSLQDYYSFFKHDKYM